MKKLIVWLMILSLLMMASCKRMEQESEGALDIYIEDRSEENKEASAETSLKEEQADQQEERPDEPTVDMEENKGESNEEKVTNAPQTEEKSQIMVTYSYVQKSPKQMQTEADLIIKGKAIKKVGQRMVNPDNTLRDSDGILISNRLVTEFEVEILEIYKGSYDGETVNVKFSCGSTLSPELILYGEDEDSVLVKKVTIPDMSIGEECILLLSMMDDSEQPQWTHGYYPFGPEGSYGYLKSDGKGNFKNDTFEASTMVVTDESLKAELAALVKDSE